MAGALFSDHTYPARMFPIEVLYFDKRMHVLATETLSGPGVLLKQHFEVPVGVQLNFADGSHEVTPPPPVHVWDAGAVGDTVAYAEWFASLCSYTDPIEGGGRCFLRAGHAEACEYKLLLPGRFGGWEVRTITFTPDSLTNLLLSEEVGHMVGALQIWTIYERPVDYPDWFVARLFLNGMSTTQIMLARSLDEIRAQIPQGLVRIDRHPSDEPQIIESWL